MTTRDRDLCSDEYLTVQVAAGGGFGRAASYLLTVPYDARAACVSDAWLRTNMSGGRYADNVDVACQMWQQVATPEAAAARRKLARS